MLFQALSFADLNCVYVLNMTNLKTGRKAPSELDRRCVDCAAAFYRDPGKRDRAQCGVCTAVRRASALDFEEDLSSSSEEEDTGSHLPYHDSVNADDMHFLMMPDAEQGTAFLRQMAQDLRVEAGQVLSGAKSKTTPVCAPLKVGKSTIDDQIALGNEFPKEKLKEGHME